MNDISGGLPGASDSAIKPALGSLSQSARKQSLRSARGILIFVGVMTALLNLFMLTQSESEVDQAIVAELRTAGLKESQVDKEVLTEARGGALRWVRLIYGGAIALGVVFVTLGAFIYRAPVAITVTGMVLYVAFTIVFAVMDPSSLVRGVIMKIIIVVAMVKAISAAVAFQRSEDATTLA